MKNAWPLLVALVAIIGIDWYRWKQRNAEGSLKDYLASWKLNPEKPEISVKEENTGLLTVGIDTNNSIYYVADERGNIIYRYFGRPAQSVQSVNGGVQSANQFGQEKYNVFTLNEEQSKKLRSNINTAFGADKLAFDEIAVALDKIAQDQEVFAQNTYSDAETILNGLM